MLPRRDGFGLLLLAWLANQAIGFGVHGCPLDPAILGWGLAIGSALFLAWVAAAALAFAATFAAYEFALFGAAFLLQGGTGAYAPVVVARLFLIDLGAFAGLSLLQALGRSLAEIRGARSLPAA